MSKKLKETFEQIKAEEELKEKTREFIFIKTNGYKKKRIINYRHFIEAAACMIFLLMGSHWLYFTSTAEISIDINPSIELGVNRFGKIVSEESFNEDGQELLNSLNIKYVDYFEAVRQIIENEKIDKLLSNDEIMMIAVTGKNEKQSLEIFSKIQSCTAEKKNTYCWYAQSEEAEKAHEMGISYGKYKAFLELKEKDPDVDVEKIKNMTMREIRDLMKTLSEGGKPKTDDLGKEREDRKKENRKEEKENKSREKGNQYRQRRKNRENVSEKLSK